MRACRAASVIAMAALLGASAIASCRESASPAVPPLTTARPDEAPSLVESTALSGASPSGLDEAGASAKEAREPPITASFVDAPGHVETSPCSRVLLAVVKGKVTALGETLAPGDVLVVNHPEALELAGAGVAMVSRRALPPAQCPAKAPVDKKIVRGNAAPKLEWAGGAMTARLDVAPPAGIDGGVSGPSPELYLGRLEGSAAVAEHVHPDSWEIIAAVEANGTLVIDGTEGRVAAGQITMIPPGAKHAWKPDPGTRLVAVQMYAPPGPEQRFVALAAADRAARDGGAHDAH